MPALTTEPAIGRRNRLPFATAARLIGLFLALLLTLGTAQVRAHDTFADGDPSNDWLRGLRNLDAEKCCDKNDCYPVQPGALKLSPDNEFKVQIWGRWFAAPHRHVLQQNIPDGRAWVCPKWRSTAGGYSYRVKGVRCLILPPMI
ncbi:hypothetical protein [Pelagibius marinus]|uniref:hypothetical protein n=1 Tax=Pelagibius marinus TaxID=2762760 RepID=UPI001872D5CE|nr:hypothetical protein [Pelagibius marinus]